METMNSKDIQYFYVGPIESILSVAIQSILEVCFIYCYCIIYAFLTPAT